jgi:hypothetical protein
MKTYRTERLDKRGWVFVTAESSFQEETIEAMRKLHTAKVNIAWSKLRNTNGLC